MGIVTSEQFKNGKNAERILDTIFQRRGWTITETTANEERTLCLGDRHYKKNRFSLLIEYKCDARTHQTGNIFLETISVDSEDKPGWVLTCKADFIFYAILERDKVLIFKPDDLRAALPELKRLFREGVTRNEYNNGYNTHGLIVPLAYAEEHLALKIITVSKP